MNGASVKEERKLSAAHKIMTVIGIVLCVILGSILTLNCILIVKSYTNPDQVPSVGGYLPLIVMTDSMYPDIQSGDLIIGHTIEPENVKVGDVISFFDPEGNGTSIVTHRVEEIITENGMIQFRTKGIANNTDDKTLVPAANLVGVYQIRLASLGHVAMFMQTTQGLILCIFCPLILLVGYDMIRNRAFQKGKSDETAALLAELEALKAQQREQENSERANTQSENSSHTDR